MRFIARIFAALILLLFLCIGALWIDGQLPPPQAPPDLAAFIADEPPELSATWPDAPDTRGEAPGDVPVGARIIACYHNYEHPPGHPCTPGEIAELRRDNAELIAAYRELIKSAPAGMDHINAQAYIHAAVRLEALEVLRLADEGRADEAFAIWHNSALFWRRLRANFVFNSGGEYALLWIGYDEAIHNERSANGGGDGIAPAILARAPHLWAENAADIREVFTLPPAAEEAERMTRRQLKFEADHGHFVVPVLNYLVRAGVLNEKKTFALRARAYFAAMQNPCAAMDDRHPDFSGGGLHGVLFAALADESGDLKKWGWVVRNLQYREGLTRLRLAVLDYIAAGYPADVAAFLRSAAAAKAPNGEPFDYDAATGEISYTFQFCPGGGQSETRTIKLPPAPA
jgi:hypothetical protein